MTPLRLIAAVTLLFLVSAATLRFAPLKPSKTETLLEAPSDRTFRARFERLAPAFDRSRLPERAPRTPAAQPAPPPRDPAAGLRRYRLIGLAASGERTIGVFEAGGRTEVLAPGATLEGFSLREVGKHGAVFTNEDNLRINLVLEIPAAD